MKIYHWNEINQIQENASCIGYFDGVHLGHQELIRKTVQSAKEKEISANVITFYPDPETVIRKNSVREITNLKRRLELFEMYGIENVLLLDFDENLMKKDAHLFIQDYIVKANVNTLICGFDFHFGYKASGNTELLMKQKEFNTIVIPEIKLDGEKISSTRIRKLLDVGQLKEAERLLGHEQ